MGAGGRAIKHSVEMIVITDTFSVMVLMNEARVICRQMGYDKCFKIISQRD